MHLKSIELSGFKSFSKKDVLHFTSPISAIVGPNGSGKSNVAEAFRFVLGEQSMKSMRGKRGEDLIFNGSNSAARANRAGVKVTFDNVDKFLDVDLDEVVIERSVHRDGVNQYAINGSNVRLRDIIELLAKANVGASGHHIISQGEADRILNTNARQRREMVEEALGLKVYQYKKQESEKKLNKTQENIDQVATLRKEIAPHLKFLERQVQKIEKTLSLKETLKDMYAEYLKREHLYFEHNLKKISSDQKRPTENIERLERELAKAKQILEESSSADSKSHEIVSLEEQQRDLRQKKEEASRGLGRIEGQIAFEEGRIASHKQKSDEGISITVPLKDIEVFEGRLKERFENVQHEQEVKELHSFIKWVRDMLHEFIHAKRAHAEADDISEDTLNDLKKEHSHIEEKLKKISSEEEEVSRSYSALRKEIESEKDESREAEREVFRIMTELGEMRSGLQLLRADGDRLNLVKEEFDREVREGLVLVGNHIKSFQSYDIQSDQGPLSEEVILSEERGRQEERRRELEKIKIRLEEAGGANSEEIMNEYKEVKDRDAFFETELADLEKSVESLKKIIGELEVELDAKFKEGLHKINTEFQNFFAILFGGGTAKLNLERPKKQKAVDTLDEETDAEEAVEEDVINEGLEVEVSLPNKRVKGLDMLSGGERALTSIALIFSMSQVNPPPFIILDETDAALDEANSRRYGDMIENLAKKSQLILITHNRETMSRAGVLYGVTMGSDGISKLLSVRLEEAVAVAK